MSSHLSVLPKKIEKEIVNVRVGERETERERKRQREREREGSVGE
jgi:hypothetical protein